MVDNTKFRVFAEDNNNVYTDDEYNNSNANDTSSRINGNQPGTRVDSKLINTALKTATLISKALLDAIVTDKELGLSTDIEVLKTTILNGLKDIRVNKALVAERFGDSYDTGYPASDICRLSALNNFKQRPTYNNYQFLIATDTINNALNANYASSAGTLTDAPEINQKANNKISIKVGGKTSTDFTIPYAKSAGEAINDSSGSNISDRFMTIEDRLENLGFKQGTFTVSVTHKGAVIPNTNSYVTQNLYKQGKIAVASFIFNASKYDLGNISVGEFKIELTIPDGFIPKELQTIYFRTIDGTGDVYLSEYVTQTNSNKIVYTHTLSNNSGDIYVQIVNQGWQIT